MKYDNAVGGNYPTVHLPECICNGTPHSIACPSCICDRLRDCEARVRDEWVRDDYVPKSFHVAVVAEVEKRGRSKQRVIDEAQFNFSRGYEQAKYDNRLALPDAYDEGFLAGYKQAKTNPCAEIPTPELAYREQYYNQHGQGENP